MDVEWARRQVADAERQLAEAHANLVLAVQEAPESDEPLFPDGHIKPGWHATSCDDHGQDYVRDDGPGVCPQCPKCSDCGGVGGYTLSGADWSVCDECQGSGKQDGDAR